MTPERKDTTQTRELPPRVLMPLLDNVTAHSLDEDYQHVAERSRHEKEHGGGKPPPQIRPGVAALVVMGLFGLLATTAAVQTARNAGDASTGRESLINQVQARSAQVDARRARIDELRAEVESLQSTFLEATDQGRSLSSRLDRLGGVTGALPVRGPGVKVVVDDAPGASSAYGRVLDKDLQKLANALWASGAEAISINGQRLANTSAIRLAGSAITVNYVSVSRPYTVLAVGNPDTMPARFVDTEHGRDWLDLRAVNGLEFAMTSEESLRLPAAPTRRVTLRHATQGERQ
jgi:uncharacterized protein YlxW (UPF0749 family)